MGGGQAFGYLFEVAIVLFFIWFVVRFVLAVIRARREQPIEPPADDMAGVPAPRKGGPRDKAAAVALSPPDAAVSHIR